MTNAQQPMTEARMRELLHVYSDESDTVGGEMMREILRATTHEDHLDRMNGENYRTMLAALDMLIQEQREAVYTRVIAGEFMEATS